MVVTGAALHMRRMLRFEQEMETETWMENWRKGYASADK